MIPLNKFLFSFVVVWCANTFASENSPAAIPSFCVNKFCSLVKNRVNPKSQMPISEAEKAITQTIIDCQKAEPKLLDKAFEEAVKRQDKESIKYICALMIRGEERRNIQREWFWKNTGLAIATIGASYLVSHLFQSEKGKCVPTVPKSN